MHTSITVNASVTWNLVEGSLHCAIRGEEGETLAVVGERFSIHLEELPAVGEETEVVARALGRELIDLAARLGAERRQAGL